MLGCGRGLEPHSLDLHAIHHVQVKGIQMINPCPFKDHKSEQTIETCNAARFLVDTFLQATSLQDGVYLGCGKMQGGLPKGKAKAFESRIKPALERGGG